MTNSECPVCHMTDLNKIATWDDWVQSCADRPDGPMRLEAAEACGVAKQQPSLLKCSKCQCVSMDPLPQNEQLSIFYNNYHGTDGYVKKARKKIFRAWKRILPLRVHSGKGKFLEVGASIGTAAEAARMLGFEAYAQEIDPEAIKLGQKMFPKVQFVESFLDQFEDNNSFASIYCCEVIEHTPEPIAFVENLYRLLKPGGYLFLTTPDAGHTKRPEPFITWKSVKPPEHIVLFTQRGLSYLLQDVGFEKLVFHASKKPSIRMVAQKPLS